MAVTADSGAIYALYDARDRYHEAVADLIGEEADTIILPMAILAEIDYLLRVRLGNRAVLKLLEGIRIGGYRLEPLTALDVNRCVSLVRTYANLNLGIARIIMLLLSNGDPCNVLALQRQFRSHPRSCR